MRPREQRSWIVLVMFLLGSIAFQLGASLLLLGWFLALAFAILLAHRNDG
jgi:hypothetical protein